MKYFAVLAAMVLLFLPPIAAGADPVVVQTDKGEFFLISQSAEGLPVFVKVRLVKLGDSTDVPVTPDDPEIPDTKFGLSKLAFSEASKLPASDRENAGKMAYAYAVPSTNLTYDSSQKLADATYEEITKILGSKKGDWPKWYEAINTRLAELERDGKLRKIEDWRTAWKEISVGLGAVK